MNHKEIFNQLDQKRKELNLSIASVCRKADISQGSWESLKKNKGYNTKTLIAVCEVLEIKEVVFKINK